MPKLPELYVDPTLEEVARQQVEMQDSGGRGYIGASSIGRPCDRSLWYSFHWAGAARYNIDTLRRFEDGHAGEALMAERLRLVNGLKLITIDQATGHQIGFSEAGGHVSGHLDGLVLGLLQAPGTWHVWEHKQVSDEKFRALEKARQEHGEKGALENWDPVYYAQAMLYCYWAKTSRHYLTCSTAGGRRITSCRTDASREVALRLLERAERIIKAATPPERISNDPTWWQCKQCTFYAICHEKKVAAVNCRTCLHSTAELTGNARWSCAKWQAEEIPLDGQRAACDEHRFIPALVPMAEVVDATETAVRYRCAAGEFENGPPGPASFSSRELSANGHAMQTMLGDVAEAFRREFGVAA